MKETTKTDKRVAVGMILALLASVSYAVSLVVGRHVVDGYRTPPLAASTISLFFGTIAVSLLSFRQWNGFKANRRALFHMTMAGVTTGVGATFILFAVREGSVAVVAPVGSINPLIALVLSAIFIRQVEVFSLKVVLGTLLVVAGVILVVVGSSL